MACLQREFSTPFSGLVNPGATCYMNSLLQQFFMIPAVRHGVLSAQPAAAEIIQVWKAILVEGMRSSIAFSRPN